jgi:endonuclease YncB( thermonuclease family)
MGESFKRVGVRWTVALALTGGLMVSGCSLDTTTKTSSNQSVSGRAKIIDGDTLEINGIRIRLEGIDAPEMAQTCQRRDGSDWRCGQAAARALENLIDDQPVVCSEQGTDIYSRVLGVCLANGRDLNQSMVTSGLAWAFIKYSTRYSSEEGDARRALKGVWQGTAQPPWDFRRNRWTSAETAAPSGCAIKGNVTNKGRIYHMPWSPWYGKVTVRAARGERWFCSEREAEAAGWRRARGA